MRIALVHCPIGHKIFSEYTAAIKLTHQYGIDTLGFFMIGSPGDTRESILSTIEFAKELNLDFIQVCRVIAKSNTAMNDLLINTKGIDYWSEYISGKREEARFPSLWTSLSEPEIERFVKRFYTVFYFRVPYLVERISKVKSWQEFFRYVSAAIKHLFRNPSDVRESSKGRCSNYE